MSCQRECYSDPTLGDYSGKTHHSLARSRPIKIGFARPNRVMTPHITSVLPCLLTTRQLICLLRLTHVLLRRLHVPLCKLLCFVVTFPSKNFKH